MPATAPSDGGGPAGTDMPPSHMTDTQTPYTADAPNTTDDDAEFARLRQNARLSLPDVLRLPLATTAAFAVGMGLGVAQGSTMAAMRFRAEHAHKLPTTTAGWYLYHKSKNYNVAYGGIREGVRMGVRVSVWTTAVFGIEALLDHYRQAADMADTVLACVTVAGAFSVWNRFPLATALRTTKTAVLVGAAYGGMQDVVGLLRGRPIGYIEWLKSRTRAEHEAAS